MDCLMSYAFIMSVIEIFFAEDRGRGIDRKFIRRALHDEKRNSKEKRIRNDGGKY